jgi:2-polyprenyl-3-methyl-5-hydroxy-6-metoxy-1,4-benzoquinol methylase
MDQIARYNMQRWGELARVNALFTRPCLDLDVASARARLDPHGQLGEVRDKTVLCLASGGGQQSAAFALLGAMVTVIDLSEEQLQRDREVASHYHVPIETLRGDMRDLSQVSAHSFDIVWQPYSINFVPDAVVVFQQVARVLKPHGLYHFSCANPFVLGLTVQDWSGAGYVLKYPYVEGVEIHSADPPWVSDSSEPLLRPREYRHKLSTLINGLIVQDFVIRHVSDSSDFCPDLNAEPGTWEHMTAFAPPWLTFWAWHHPMAKRELAPVSECEETTH